MKRSTRTCCNELELDFRPEGKGGRSSGPSYEKDDVFAVSPASGFWALVKLRTESAFPDANCDYRGRGELARAHS